MDNPWVALGVALLGAVAVFMLGRLSTRWDRSAAARDRDELATINRRLEEVEGTRRGFEARNNALFALMHGDIPGMVTALDAIQAESGLMKERYFGSKDWLRRWWTLKDRTEATYVGTDRAQQGPPDPEWVHELRVLRTEGLEALGTAREAVAAGQTVGDDLANDPELLAERERRREDERVRMFRFYDEVARAVQAPVHWTQRTEHRAEVIPVANIPPGGPPVIEGHTFEDCTFVGPAVMTFVGETVWEAPHFVVSQEAAAFWTWSPEEFVKPDGVIAFGATTLRRCRFERITIAGSDGDISRLRESLSPSPPQG